jgi:hypothetical protein
MNMMICRNSNIESIVPRKDRVDNDWNAALASTEDSVAPTINDRPAAVAGAVLAATNDQYSGHNQEDDVEKNDEDPPQSLPQDLDSNVISMPLSVLVSYYPSRLSSSSSSKRTKVSTLKILETAISIIERSDYFPRFDDDDDDNRSGLYHHHHIHRHHC